MVEIGHHRRHVSLAGERYEHPVEHARLDPVIIAVLHRLMTDGQATRADRATGRRTGPSTATGGSRGLEPFSLSIA